MDNQTFATFSVRVPLRMMELIDHFRELNGITTRNSFANQAFLAFIAPAEGISNDQRAE